MILKNKLSFLHNLGDCEFRTINEDDVTEKYVNALKNEHKYLKNIPRDVNLITQSEYVRKVIESESDTICGLFLNSELIGTAGIQNIVKNGKASIGILLFGETIRGHGFGKVLIWASSVLVNNFNEKISYFAGMKKENKPSLKAFLACGFSIKSKTVDGYIVEMDFQDIKTLGIINNIRFY